MSAEYAGQRVLVTGARGFLGSNLVPRLAAAGAAVHCVSRGERPAEAVGRWWRADLGDRAAVERLFAEVGPEAVFHLAGHVTASPGIEQVGPTFHSLLTSTVFVLLASATSGVRRVVLTGSTDELSLCRNCPDPPTPPSPYGAAKWAASAYGRMFHSLYGTPVVVVRPVLAFGPHQPADKVVPTVIGALLRGDAPRLSSCSAAADWAYVDDIADGVFRAGHVAGVEGRTYDLGSGRLTTVREVVQQIVELVRERRGDCPEPAFGALPDRPHEEFEPADVEPALADLGWRTTTSLEAGLRQTIEWLARPHRPQIGSDREALAAQL